MKGLLIKDFYTLTKQLKMFLLLIAFFSFLPGSSTAAFAVIYSAMLPITALAYDERSKWDKLAAMMPYTASSLVLGKYVLGYICVAAAATLSFIVRIALSLYSKEPITVNFLMETLPIVCIALIFEAINLPLMLKLGVEKGRLAFFALTAIIIIGGVAFKDKVGQLLGSLQMNFIFFIVFIMLAAVVINAISIALSIRIYKHKEN